jgi:hypothetical protein
MVHGELKLKRVRTQLMLLTTLKRSFPVYPLSSMIYFPLGLSCPKCCLIDLNSCNIRPSNSFVVLSCSAFKISNFRSNSICHGYSAKTWKDNALAPKTKLVVVITREKIILYQLTSVSPQNLHGNTFLSVERFK